jgi:hypothetical protein
MNYECIQKTFQFDMFLYVSDTHTFVPKKNVGFWLGWDTQIPRNPNPNKTHKSHTQPKNHQNFDPKIPKA